MPGNIQNGIDGLRAIYKIVTHYRAKMSGGCTMRYGSDIIKDVSEHPLEYGYANEEEASRVFHNPDAMLSDMVKEANAKSAPVLYIMNCNRFDGTTVGDPKPTGTRDVLASTPMYVYQNRRLYQHEKMTYNPVGYYLVLWDDGEIEKIPYDKVVYTPLKNPDRFGYRKTSEPRWITAYNGQAGVSPNALSYDDEWRGMGMKRGPRGKEGKKGESPDDLAAHAKR